MISVRDAQPGDGAALLEATRVLAAVHGMSDRVMATAEMFEHALFQDHPIIGALIAQDDGAFAGSIVWHRSFSTNAGREIIYLEDIVVLPDHRRKGVARALMKALATLAVRRGFPTIYWLMAQWNAEAESFYKNIGAEIYRDFAILSLRDAALTGLTE